MHVESDNSFVCRGLFNVRLLLLVSRCSFVVWWCWFMSALELCIFSKRCGKEGNNLISDFKWPIRLLVKCHKYCEGKRRWTFHFFSSNSKRTIYYEVESVNKIIKVWKNVQNRSRQENCDKYQCLKKSPKKSDRKPIK